MPDPEAAAALSPSANRNRKLIQVLTNERAHATIRPLYAQLSHSRFLKITVPPKPAPARVELPKGGYRRTMMFNRFLVEPVDNFVVLHFGLLNAAGFVLDRYSCALFREDLEMQKQSLIAYLGQLG